MKPKKIAVKPARLSAELGTAESELKAFVSAEKRLMAAHRKAKRRLKQARKGLKQLKRKVKETREKVRIGSKLRDRLLAKTKKLAKPTPAKKKAIVRSRKRPRHQARRALPPPVGPATQAPIPTASN